MGPAFVAAVAYVDPGNVAANLAAGAGYGYLLVWVLVVANVVAMLVQYLSAKLGLVTGHSLPELVGGALPRRGSRLAYWFQAELVAAATDLAEVIGGAVALQLLFGLPLIVGGLMTGALSLAILAIPSRHGQRTFEIVIIGMLVVIAIGFTAGVSWGFAPTTSEPISYNTHLIRFSVIIIACMASCLAAWFAGSATRDRRQTMAALRQRAIDLERERDQSIRLATQEERAKIARDIHDIVAHSLSVIVVQADGGAYLAHHEEAGDIETRLSASGQALDTIATTARHALDETRRLVGVLRDNDAGPQLSPTQGLDDIPNLIREMKGALAITLTIKGRSECHEPLSQGAELACYRVVQEALTNVLKHGGPTATAHVTISHHPDDVTLDILDDGRGTSVTGIERADGAGHGLVGMRERMSAWGGTLEVGSRPGHGFRVRAVIPTR
jgi:signal transduction histidine kinase